MSSPSKTVNRTREKSLVTKPASPAIADKSNARARKSPAAITPSPKAGRKGARAGASAAATSAASQPAAAGNNTPKAKEDAADDFITPVKEYVKPHNQLRLSEAELEEELACSLTAGNPAAPSNIARYHLKDSTYKVEHNVDQMLQHYSSEGWLTYQEPAAPLSRQTSMRSQARSFTKDAGDAPGEAHVATNTERLRNQFNFNDRTTQTTNYQAREASTMTEPPPSKESGGSTSQREIFDAYKAHQERARAAEDQAKARPALAKKGTNMSSLAEQSPAERAAKERDDKNTEAMERMTQLLERICNQNVHKDIISDFKYWDDPADDIQEREGTLLPLWRFTAAPAQGRHVTALAWNPAYPDLFAAGYGSFDAQRQGTGAVVCFSLKDPSTPESQHQTSSGVMCLDFHPQQANILAVGFHNGSIEVLDVLRKRSQPLYRATAASGKHGDAVTSIRWLNGASAGLRGLAFYSASMDGRVLHWTLGKSAMSFEDFFSLQKPPRTVKAAKAPTLEALNMAPQTATSSYGATCMDFHKELGHILLVGTEEGAAHQCSTALAAEALTTYGGHAGAVYSLSWNRRHADVFLSASADWTVKLWLSGRSQVQAVMTFDLGCAAGDAAWAPYSATVFAAAGEDGRVQVFDLAANKVEPLSKQKIHATAGLTRLAFNAHYPILLVGDDRGCVHCLKLSPNLRRHSKVVGAQAADSSVQQLDAILAVALKSMNADD